MYGLPPSTIINQPLYKKTVFEKFNLKTAERERFDADISKMALVARISPATVPALAEGQEIKGFYVLQVTLKQREYDAKNILLLQKLIPQKIVYALQFEEQTQLCVFHTRLQQSDWMPTEETCSSKERHGRARFRNGISSFHLWLPGPPQETRAENR